MILDIKPEDRKRLDSVLRATASTDKKAASASQQKFAKALELPLRKGVMSGNILDNIFSPVPLDINATPEFPLHYLSPGTEKDFVAYTIPNQGYIPQRTIEGDYVMVPTFDVGASIDWNIKYARDARWDVVSDAYQNFADQFVKKMNDDGWHTILAAGVDRAIVVLDSDAAAGQFTKRLVSLGQTVMRRNGGGNSTSRNRGRLTDLYMSPEAMQDIRNWNVDQVDEMTRREIFNAENGLTRIFQVNLHDIDELGEGQEYQLYFENELSGTLPGSDVEILVGLDLSKRDSFVMPVRNNSPEIYEDDTLMRQRKQGIYGWMSYGMGCLDNRRVLLLSI